MATTLKFINGDVVINTSSGRPKVIGNVVGTNVESDAREKNSQDLRLALTTNRILSRATASINELIGIMEQTGAASTRMLLNRNIRAMFANILRVQKFRPAVRPTKEQFSNIVLLQIFRSKDAKTSFRFRLDVQTVDGKTSSQSGTILG